MVVCDFCFTEIDQVILESPPVSHERPSELITIARRKLFQLTVTQHNVQKQGTAHDDTMSVSSAQICRENQVQLAQRRQHYQNYLNHRSDDGLHTIYWSCLSQAIVSFNNSPKPSFDMKPRVLVRCKNGQIPIINCRGSCKEDNIGSESPGANHSFLLVLALEKQLPKVHCWRENRNKLLDVAIVGLSSANLLMASFG